MYLYCNLEIRYYCSTSRRHIQYFFYHEKLFELYVEHTRIIFCHHHEKLFEILFFVIIMKNFSNSKQADKQTCIHVVPPGTYSKVFLLACWWYQYLPGTLAHTPLTVLR